MRGQRGALPSNSGRKQYNVLGVYSPLDGEYLDEQATESLNAKTAIRLGEKIRRAHPEGGRLIIFRDNMHHLHARLVRGQLADT